MMDIIPRVYYLGKGLNILMSPGSSVVFTRWKIWMIAWWMWNTGRLSWEKRVIYTSFHGRGERRYNGSGSSGHDGEGRSRKRSGCFAVDLKIRYAILIFRNICGSHSGQPTPCNSLLESFGIGHLVSPIFRVMRIWNWLFLRMRATNQGGSYPRHLMRSALKSPHFLLHDLLSSK